MLVSDLKYTGSGAYAIYRPATAGRPKSLDGKDLAVLHLTLVGVLDKRDGLPSVDPVLLDVVSGNVPYRLDRERLAVDLHLVAFHGLLDGRAYIADADIDPGVLEDQLFPEGG